MNPDKPMTVNQCAEWFQVHPKTILRWCEQKRIPFGRVGKRRRFFWSEVNAAIRGGGSGPVNDQLAPRVSAG